MANLMVCLLLVFLPGILLMAESQHINGHLSIVWWKSFAFASWLLFVLRLLRHWHFDELAYAQIMPGGTGGKGYAIRIRHMIISYAISILVAILSMSLLNRDLYREMSFGQLIGGWVLCFMVVATVSAIVVYSELFAIASICSNASQARAARNVKVGQYIGPILCFILFEYCVLSQREYVIYGLKVLTHTLIVWPIGLVLGLSSARNAWTMCFDYPASSSTMLK